MSQPCYIVLGSKSWNREIFETELRPLPGNWIFIATPDELTLEKLYTLKPRYLFFLHWSWIVPPEIVNGFECVCFHMTDVPYGRGGSPLQNLILRGHRETKLTALRMVQALDAGPVYLKQPLSLEGTAAEILARASALSVAMIKTILTTQPTPQPQSGEVTLFKRRKPADSAIPPLASSEKLYDFIRMLDGEGYPPACIEHAGFRYEFTRASLHDGRVVATVNITPTSSTSP
jgi:methionyl-tRNA formyltransferase